jgi:hypothetical protein
MEIGAEWKSDFRLPTMYALYDGTITVPMIYMIHLVQRHSPG